jgi:hypothetical protein
MGGRTDSLASDPTCRPRGLEIESPGDAINVECLTGEMQTRNESAFHRFEINL